ncbi:MULTISPECIES: Acb2/Tad1 domain-containing protein [Streptomycetaceae]|uniref:Acb2/Tad1 hairpin domain-containing protein n=1 Tax=Streptantibioticus cattleyicolor (strain ATCC 35852 / DSM 46488 / JCM 4925 / NBRC 14057 / NRRL 8057) TaxID=1003195 RepID=F8JY58_STREN|nr:MULTISPECIES: hypothetical protein [Streptomycetaceae]AEW94634.1 hypothetical protein SCATT_22630 [Streptantibioticus cattleyicolor NRRL 8057 = DSM 46488]MYS59272.1 hypothetical protein [Streptomyces sp. SID5468]CCB74991.1 protein of unknown function [Streptantibioticus cattleyicolor NRRL 8057 = DSM 46488]
MAITRQEIALRFAAPRTDPERTAVKARLSSAAAEFGLLIHELVPGSREQSIALTALEQAVAAAHSGVDRRAVMPGEHRGPDGVHRIDACTCGHPVHGRGTS